MTSHKHLPISIKSNLFTTRVTEVSPGFHHLLVLVQIMFKDQNVSLTHPLPSKSMLLWIFIWKNINSLFGDSSVVRVRSFSEVRRLVSFIVWLTHKGNIQRQTMRDEKQRLVFVCVCFFFHTKKLKIWIYCGKYKEGFRLS